MSAQWQALWLLFSLCQIIKPDGKLFEKTVILVYNMSMLNIILSAGITLAFALVIFCLVKWRNLRCIGVTPVPVFTFIAILFTSGLDVGLIMFPLTEFAGYADIQENPEYAFSNPLAIEFGYWGFLIWAFYFLTSFYFCVIEPRVNFFKITPVRIINNIVIIGTCAFTAYLFLINLRGMCLKLETVKAWC